MTRLITFESVRAARGSSRRFRGGRPACTPLEGRCLLSVSLSAIEPPGSAVGVPVTWTATSDGLGDAPVYQFSVGPAGGDSRVVRDFSPAGDFTWNPMREGTFEVRVTAKAGYGAEAGESTGATYTVSSRVDGDRAVISPTGHPLVALYSAPPSSGITMRVEFRPEGSEAGWSRTSPLIVEPGRSTNFLVAGMLAETTYEMRHVLNDGDASDPQTFTTGSLPEDLTFPTFRTDATPPPRSEPAEGVVLHLGIEALTDPSNVSTLATNREGDVLWYYDTLANEFHQIATTLVPGGTIFMFSWRPAWRSLREIDLAGNVVRETNVEAVNAKLAAIGEEPIHELHHDVRLLPNGRLAVLGASEREIDLDGTPTTYNGDMVIVMDQNLQVDWVWDPFDWLDTDRLPTQNEGPADWMHSNAITWSPSDGNLLISIRSLDRVIKIDYANGTGDGHVVWTLGRDGDFAIDSPDPSPWFTHQHDPRYIDDTSLVVFDNGNTRHSEDPNANSRGQMLVLDEKAMHARLALNADLGEYALALGSAQRLPGGNFLFNSGLTSTVFEVTPGGEIVSRLSMDFPGAQYRSYYYDTLYGDDPEPVGSASRFFDLDGDLRADLLAYDPDTAQWVITYADGRQETRRFGAAGDVAVPGDYDGDGLTDLAVYRPESDLMPGAAHWFASLSGGGVISRPFGAAGGEGAPADYDGDGTTDVGVYRPETAEAFLLRSRDEALHLVYDDLETKLGPRSRLIGPRRLWFGEDDR